MGKYLSGNLKSYSILRSGNLASIINENLLEDIFNNINDSISVIDSDYNILAVNRIFLKSLGLVEGDVIGKKCYEVTHGKKEPCTLPLDPCPLNDTMKNVNHSSYEHIHLQKDGSNKYFEVSTTPIKDKNGKIRQVIHIARDISKRKELELELKKSNDELERRVKKRTASLIKINEKLKKEIGNSNAITRAQKKSESKYSTLVENSSDGIIIIVNDELRFANSTMKKITGFSNTDMIGKPFIDFISPEYRKMVMGYYKKRLEGENIDNNYEIEIFSKQGEKIPVEIAASVIRFEDETATMVIIKNLTNKKKIEKDLAFLAELTKNSHDAIAVLDMDGSFSYWNESAQEIFGYREEEIIGQSFGLLVPDDLKHTCYNFLENSIENGFLRNIETERIHKNGRRIPVEMTLSPLYGSRNNQTGFIFILRDITERKRAEESIRKSYDEMKGINELKNNILANVSHELKTPLSIIKSAFEILADEEEDEEKTEIINMGLKSVDRQNNIIEDLVTLSLVSKVKEDKRSLMDLDEIVKDILSSFEDIAYKKGIKINYKYNKMPKLYGNPVNIKRAIRNLIDNAIKFNKKDGEVSVELNFTRGEKYVVIKVMDTGVGIKEEDQNRIFNPLTQLDPSTSRQYEGTGSGLAVVRIITKEHGGEISIESDYGKGSIFYLKLPLG